MSLLLWEYFWDGTAWVATPPPAASPPESNAGARGRNYRPLPDEFWEIRDRYLRRFVEPAILRSSPSPTATATPPPNPLSATITEARLNLLVQARTAALSRARAATNRAELLTAANRTLKLTLDISTLTAQYYERAAIILLLDLF